MPGYSACYSPPRTSTHPRTEKLPHVSPVMLSSLYSSASCTSNYHPNLTGAIPPHREYDLAELDRPSTASPGSQQHAQQLSEARPDAGTARLLQRPFLLSRARMLREDTHQAAVRLADLTDGSARQCGAKAKAGPGAPAAQPDSAADTTAGTRRPLAERRGSAAVRLCQAAAPRRESPGRGRRNETAAGTRRQRVSTAGWDCCSPSKVPLDRSFCYQRSRASCSGRFRAESELPICR